MRPKISDIYKPFFLTVVLLSCTLLIPFFAFGSEPDSIEQKFLHLSKRYEQKIDSALDKHKDHLDKEIAKIDSDINIIRNTSLSILVTGIGSVLYFFFIYIKKIKTWALDKIRTHITD